MVYQFQHLLEHLLGLFWRRRPPRCLRAHYIACLSVISAVLARPSEQSPPPPSIPAPPAVHSF